MQCYIPPCWSQCTDNGLTSLCALSHVLGIPQAASRPTFSQLLQALCQPEAVLLSWSEEDMTVHRDPQAAVLGAP